MLNANVYAEASRKFGEIFGTAPTSVAYAPGRVEVLGNHTDYNEGFVLSAGIDYGTFFLAKPSTEATCRLVAGDIMDEATFDIGDPGRSDSQGWSNYIRGMAAMVTAKAGPVTGFHGLFLGNIPIGSGLSSSAALEMSSGLCLADLYGQNIAPLDLARMGQSAEHEYAGVKCGLLDQISSLFATADALVMSDFRSLEVASVPMGHDACFVVCNTGVKHALVDGEYNARRAHCEEAAAAFAETLDHPVTALRDVSWEAWEAHRGRMAERAAQRAAHVIGENARVLEGRDLLESGDLAGFGALMFASHESSRTYFENSCRELDFIVATAREIPGALGARLSGGGFGGSAVVLCNPRDAETVAHAIAHAYGRQFDHDCETLLIRPSDGAHLVAEPATR